jgi:hypothetical protein
MQKLPSFHVCGLLLALAGPFTLTHAMASDT